jgi:hypothetical protein
LAAPPTDVTRAEHPWEWTKRCEQSSLVLKHCLNNAPLFVFPDVDEHWYEVVTTASIVGIGAVLLLDNRPIAFKLRKLSDSDVVEKNYNTIEQEMLAVVHAPKRWQCYVEGATFIVVTDHVSNTFFDT